jgi:4-hydroxybenzoate polyprenyltransferase
VSRGTGSNPPVRLLPILRLVRVGTLFSPAADVVAGVAIAGLPWTTDVLRAALASVCLYAGGMVWNDVADRRIDAVQRPERPLPRGDLSLAFAIGLGAALFVGGLVLSPCPWHHALIGALVLLYDFAGKLVAWASALLMGSLRALNLATALAMSSTSGTIAAAPQKALVIAAVCYGVYIVAVTVLGIFEDLPKVHGRAVAAVATAPPLAAFCGLATVQGGFWPAPALATLPILLFLRRNAARRVHDQCTIRQTMTWLLLGTMLYTGLLALAAGEPWAAGGILAAIVPARRISRAIALT